MPLTITLRITEPNQAEVRLDNELINSFNTQDVLSEHVISDPRSYGKQLWAVLGGDVLQSHVNRLPHAPHPGSLIKIQSEHPDLTTISCEYMHNGDDFIVFDYLFVREVVNVPLPPTPDPTKPWRIVTMGSTPLIKPIRDSRTGYIIDYQQLPQLNVDRELNTIRDNLQHDDSICSVRWHRIAPTFDDLAAVAAEEPILFHYTGHGLLQSGETYLCFDDGSGRLSLRSAREIARILRGRVYLAFLNSCDSATSTLTSNLVQELVKHGVPYALGMQSKISDELAAKIAVTFYKHLIVGESPDIALYHVRQQLRTLDEAHPQNWAIPTLYAAANYDWPTQNSPSYTLPVIREPTINLLALQAPLQFVGRSAELVDLATLFYKEDVQVITLRGSGGIGKSALAHELANRLRFLFRDGVFAISLTLPASNPILDAAMVRQDLARHLGITGHAAFEVPNNSEEQEAVILNELSQRKILLIFDNYETILWRLNSQESDLGTAKYSHDQRAEAELIHRLITRLASIGKHLLFTSRQSPVGIIGEVLYPDAQKGLQLDGLDPRSSETLFRLHAGGRGCSEHFIQQVASAVEYNPLALLLSAVRWSRTQQSEEEFSERLFEELLKSQRSGVPDHQRSVFANVALSINILPPDLRHSFYALSVIANPFIYSAQAAVVWELSYDHSTNLAKAFTVLEQIRNYGLLDGLEWNDERNRPYAYRIQPIVDQILHQLVENVDLSAARESYAFWISEVIERSYGEGGIEYNIIMSQETYILLPDIYAAVSYMPEEIRGWLACRAAFIFRLYGYPDMEARMLDIAERMTNQSDDKNLQALYYRERATMLRQVGKTEEAYILFEKSLQLTDYSDDTFGSFGTLLEVAHLHAESGEYSKALEIYKKLLEVSNAENLQRPKSVVLSDMANIFVHQGDYEQAMRLYTDARFIQNQMQDLRGKTVTLSGMAIILVKREDFSGALALYQEALDINQELSMNQGRNVILHNMADALLEMDNLDEATEYYQKAFDISVELNDVRMQGATLHRLAIVNMQKGKFYDALELHKQALDIYNRIGDIPGKSGVLHDIAFVQILQGEPELAEECYDQAIALSREQGSPSSLAGGLFMSAQFYWLRGMPNLALQNATESLALYRELQDTKHANFASGLLSQLQEQPELSIARLMGNRVAATTEAIKNNLPLADFRRQVGDVSQSFSALKNYEVALLNAVDHARGASSELLAVAIPLLKIDHDWWARGDTLMGISHVAYELGDRTTAVDALELAVEAFQHVSDENQKLSSLRLAFHNLGALHINQQNYGSAVPYFEQAIAFGFALNDSAVEEDQVALDFARQHTHETQRSPLHRPISMWIESTRNIETLVPIILVICREVTSTIREGTLEEREHLAGDLSLLRIRQDILPISDLSNFLHVLQLWLRTGVSEGPQIKSMRSSISNQLNDLLASIQRSIVGTFDEGDTLVHERWLTIILEALSPDQQTEFTMFQFFIDALKDVHRTISQYQPNDFSFRYLIKFFETIIHELNDETRPTNQQLAYALYALIDVLYGRDPNISQMSPLYSAMLNALDELVTQQDSTNLSSSYILRKTSILLMLTETTLEADTKEFFGIFELIKKHILLVEDLFIKNQILHETGTLLWQHKLYQDALPYFQQELEVNDLLSDTQGRSVTLGWIASILTHQGKYDEAMSLLQEAIAVKRSLNDIQGEASDLNLMADIMIHSKEYYNALNYYNEMLKLYKSLCNFSLQADTLCKIAMAYLLMGSHKEAIEAAQSGIVLYQSLGDLKGLDVATELYQTAMNVHNHSVVAVASEQTNRKNRTSRTRNFLGKFWASVKGLLRKRNRNM